jgi:hypothetical protein
MPARRHFFGGILMKKGLRILCSILALGLAFLLGWRGMPRVWPSIKEAVVYPVFPQMKPAPEPTPEPYTPYSSAAFDDPIAANDSVVYYFYKDYCPWCRQLEPLTAGLPDHIILPDGISTAHIADAADTKPSTVKMNAPWYALIAAMSSIPESIRP